MGWSGGRRRRDEIQRSRLTLGRSTPACESMGEDAGYATAEGVVTPDTLDQDQTSMAAASSRNLSSVFGWDRFDRWRRDR